jgi:hypothetical protein
MPQNDRFKAGQLHVRVPGADPLRSLAIGAMNDSNAAIAACRGRCR